MRRPRHGFTLLEVLVATTIMAVAVATLLSALTTSVRNAGRVSDSDRAVMLAKNKMDELLAEPELPVNQVLQGLWDPRMVGVNGGWRARVEPFESFPRIPANVGGLYRVVVEVWWSNGNQRQTFLLEGYRRIMRPR